MKKFFISAAAVLAALSLNAKVFTVGDVHQVNLGNTGIDQPALSADGNFVIALNNAKGGLQKIDLATGTMETVVEGSDLYDVAISADGKTVVYTRPSFNDKHLRHTSMEAVNLDTRNVETIVKASRNMAAGVALTNTTAKAINNGKVAKKSVNKNADKQADRAVVAINRGHLTVNGKAIDPQGAGSYLWPSLSPDGTKIVYWCVYRGCFVCDLDGSNAQPVGGLRAAVWAGNDVVIGMDEKEGNAQQVEASALVAHSLATGEKQVLTPETVRAQYPSANADATRVAFTDPEGNLYYIDITK